MRIRVANCNADTDQFCVVRRNQAAQIQLQFATRHPSRQLNAQLHAQVGNLWFPWSIGQASNACSALQVGRCPAQQNAQLIFGFGLTIPNQAPPNTNALVRIQVWNENQHVQSCVLIRVRVL